MILVADSGSTKTEWFLIGEDRIMSSLSTSGINPYLISTQQIAAILRSELMLKIIPQSITHVYFYGAGCSTEARCLEVSAALEEIFLSAEVEVDHDLFGAARALCGNTEGIACILGTGSNSCLFDGHKILDNIPSLGYILGDEGSGSHIGKSLLKGFFYREMPADIQDAFVAEYNIKRDEVLEQIYRKALPNRYLASFSLFAGKHTQHPYIKKMLSSVFESFLDIQVAKYAGYQEKRVHFTGSVAYHYASIIKEIAKAKGIRYSNFLKSPAQALAQYHLEEFLRKKANGKV